MKIAFVWNYPDNQRLDLHNFDHADFVIIQALSGRAVMLGRPGKTWGST